MPPITEDIILSNEFNYDKNWCRIDIPQWFKIVTLIKGRFYLTDQIQEWFDQYIYSDYKVILLSTNGNCNLTFFFENYSSAILFKLTWC